MNNWPTLENLPHTIIPYCELKDCGLNGFGQQLHQIPTKLKYRLEVNALKQSMGFKAQKSLRPLRSWPYIKPNNVEI